MRKFLVYILYTQYILIATSNLNRQRIVELIAISLTQNRFIFLKHFDHKDLVRLQKELIVVRVNVQQRQFVYMSTSMGAALQQLLKGNALLVPPNNKMVACVPKVVNMRGGNGIMSHLATDNFHPRHPVRFVQDIYDSAIL